MKQINKTLANAADEPAPQPADVRNLALTAEDAELLEHILRWAFKNHPSKHIKSASIIFLKQIEDLQNQQ
jgi:hypothetical protein